MQLYVSQKIGYVLAKTEGPLDDTAGTLFREQLHPLVCQGGTKLVLDLSGSPRINSEGIAQLVKLVADANTKSSRVILAAVTPFVLGVMEVSRLDRYFDIATDLNAALAMMG